jgi:phosphomevalonate kinase
MATTTVVSSPGKVLIAGGYLVLDSQYSGVVVSTSSRFFTIINAKDSSGYQIQVRSPQFLDAVWDYSIAFGQDGVNVLTDSDKYDSATFELVRFMMILGRARTNSFIWHCRIRLPWLQRSRVWML